MDQNDLRERGWVTRRQFGKGVSRWSNHLLRCALLQKFFMISVFRDFIKGTYRDILDRCGWAFLHGPTYSSLG